MNGSSDSAQWMVGPRRRAPALDPKHLLLAQCLWKADRRAEALQPRAEGEPLPGR